MDDFVEPSNAEGRRRTARALRMGGIIIASIAVVGTFFDLAMRKHLVGYWAAWGVLLLVLIVGFVVEHRREIKLRQRKPTKY